MAIWCDERVVPSQHMCEARLKMSDAERMEKSNDDVEGILLLAGCPDDDLVWRIFMEEVGQELFHKGADVHCDVVGNRKARHRIIRDLPLLGGVNESVVEIENDDGVHLASELHA